jgi:hypothetical protein
MSEKALVLRTCKADLSSHGGFRWPESGPVEAPDWSPEPVCGGGLHGWLWGEGNGELGCWEPEARWLVVEVDADAIVDLDGKVKFPRGAVVYCGDRLGATNYLAANGGQGKAIVGVTLTGGYRATLTGGYRATLTGGNGATLTGGNGATLTGGDGATLTGGDWATLTGGDGATLTGGYRAKLTGGDGATLTGGYRATLTGGDGATLTGGDGATLVFYWHDGRRKRLAVGYVGEGGIEPNTPYRCNDVGEIIKVLAEQEVEP